MTTRVMIISFEIELVGENKPGYNNHGKDWLAVKERSNKLVSRKTVSASLQDDRGTWVVRGRVYDPETGKTRQRTRSTGLKVKNNTKRKAKEKMAEIIAEWTNEANSIPIENSPLLSVYVRRFIDKKKELGREADTIASYEEYSRLHINPKLGNIPIGEISIQDIEDFYAAYLQTHKVNSAKRVHVVLSGAFNEALKDGTIRDNIAKSYEFKKAEKYTGARVYSKEEVDTLLKQAEKEGEPIYSAVVLGVCYGLRRSEVCGLRWTDFDFKEKVFTVSNVIVQVEGVPVEKETTKTSKSNRSIPLLPNTIAYFKQLREAQDKKGLKADKVCAWDDGRPVRPDFVTRAVKKVEKKCGLATIRFHDLRHTAASLLAPHVSPKQLQDFLGHEDISTTFGIYTHIVDEQRRATSNAMNQIIGGAFVLEECSGEKAESQECELLEKEKAKNLSI